MFLNEAFLLFKKSKMKWTNFMNNKNNYTKSQLFWLVVLRVLIGWYFLYEGLAKVLTPDWTSYGYLMDSNGIFEFYFKMLTESHVVISIVDAINVYGLILIGLSLILGCLSRIGYIGAVSLLILYCLSHPALLDASYIFRPEGSYLWVDKNLIILSSVVVLMVFPTSKIIGLDRYIFRKVKE